MKRLKMPKLGRPTAKHRGAGRSANRTHEGQHRKPDTVIDPWSERSDYRGRHRSEQPSTPPLAKTGRRKELQQGRRLTPLMDRPRPALAFFGR